MYLEKNQIKSIQLDHTSRCNLLCPQCARTSDNGAVKSSVQIKDLTVDDYKIILEPLSKNVKIMHCGNYGDVIASPTFDETLDWCISNGYNNIQILTNGSARKPSWWADLAYKKVSVVFSVDGLAETNHIYRVNSVFKIILENMKAFINAGGIARWDYLVFNHNFYQLEDAKQLAKDIGIQEFNIKYTSRFVNPHVSYNPSIINKNNIQVTDIKDNKNASSFNEIIQTYTDFSEYVKKTPITCKYQELSRYYIDMEMRLWPCCWMGAPIYSNNSSDPQYRDLIKVYDKFGENFNRLDIHGWDSIINSEYYQSFLEGSWEIDNPNRIFTCGRTCGDKYQFSSGYGSNQKIQKLN